MVENPSPTGGTNPTVAVVEPLNNNQEVNQEQVTTQTLTTESVAPPLLPSEQSQTDITDEPPLLPSEQKQQETKEPPLLPSEVKSNKSTFDFGELAPAIADSKDTQAKLQQVKRKTPQELFAPKLEIENTKITPPLDDISKAQLNHQVNNKYLPNTGTVDFSSTGAPVIQKEDTYELERIASSETPQNPDVTNVTLTGVSAENSMALLNAGKMPTFTSMEPEQAITFRNLLQVENVPQDKIVYPEVRTKELNSTLSSLRQVDVDLNKKLEDENNLLREQGAVNVTDPDAMNKVVNKIQGIRNGGKYKVYQDAGFVGAIPTDLPENIQDALRSQEYINSTASDKKLYAKMLWFTNKDKFATPEEFYAKIKQTFTPAVTEIFLKQKAKENLKELNSFQFNRDAYGNDATLGRFKDIVNHAKALYSELADADFENEGGLGSKVLFAIKHHGTDAVPFLATAFDLSGSADLYKIINKVKVSGVDSLSKEDKALYDATEMLNSYYQLSKPDKLTTAINNAPAFLAFLGELTVGAPVGEMIGGAVNAGVKGVATGIKDAAQSAAFAKSFLYGSASKTMQVAIKETPTIADNLLNIFKAVDGVAGGTISVSANNLVGKSVGRLSPVLATALMSRSQEIINNTVKEITQTPVEYISWKDYQYIHEQLPANSQNFWQSLKKNAAFEAANIGAMEVAKVIGEAQNDLIGSLMSRFPKESTERKVLGWLKANQFEAKAAARGEQTGVESFLQRVKTFSPASVVPDIAAYGLVLPPVESVIEGKWKEYSDALSKNPYSVVKNQIQGAAIGLAVPVLGGKLFGLRSLVDFEKYTSPYEYKFREFRSNIVEMPKEEFLQEGSINKLRIEADKFSATGNRRKNIMGKAMQAAITHRESFENGKIDGAKGETYKEYVENEMKSQVSMNELLDRVKQGDVTDNFLLDAIENSANADIKSEFIYHKDLVDAYSTAGRDGETLKQYVDREKQPYFDIKNDFALSRSLATKPNWSGYERRINDLMLPEVYKRDLKNTLDELRADEELENEKLYGNKEGDVAELQPYIYLGEKGNLHVFTLQADGTYKFESSNPDDAHSDIDFRLQSMSVADIMNLHNASRNSNIDEVLENGKQKISESVKKSIISEFAENERFHQLGGIDNAGHLLDMLNTVSESSPLTAEEKRDLTNQVINILANEVNADSSDKNYNEIKNMELNLVKNANVVGLSDVLRFHSKLTTRINKARLADMSVGELENDILTADEDARKLIAEEVEERKNSDRLTGEDLQRLMHDLALNPIRTNVDLQELRKSNPSIAKVLDKVYSLRKNPVTGDGILSEDGITLIENLLCSIDHRYFDVGRVELGKVEGTESETQSAYFGKSSKTIQISRRKGISEQTLITELQEEIWHNIEHNLFNSVATGGMWDKFTLTDAELTEIAGSDSADVITKIAKWYKGKDYDYNRFLKLKGMKRTEMTDAESNEYQSIKSMLERISQKPGAVGKWDNMVFEDRENKVNGESWKFTTQQLVENWNRYQQMRTAIRPGGKQYSAAQAFYYSAYKHEYVARNMADYNIKEVQDRLASSPDVVKIAENANGFFSKLKVPGFLKMLRSEVFKSAPEKVVEMMSETDKDNLLDVVTNADKAPTPEMLKDFNNILKDVSTEPVEHFRTLVKDTNNPDALNNFVIQLCDNATKLGYDKSIVSDILAHLNKEIGLIGAKSDEATDEKRIMYVSNTLKALESLKIEKTSGANWMDKILSSGGKKVEIERYGLDTFLKENKSPTKQDILDFLSDKVMKVKDVVLGGEVDKRYSELNETVEQNKNRIIQLGTGDYYYDSIEPFTNPGGKLIEEYLFNAIDNANKLNELEPISDDKKFEILGYVKNIREAKLEIFEMGGGSNDIDKTRHSSWTTFPLNNYRELLPVIDTDQKLFSHESHFSGIQNQLYHNRLNDVSTTDGKKLLLSEEMQADWGKNDVQLQGNKLAHQQHLTANIKQLKSDIEFNQNRLDNKDLKEFNETTKGVIERHLAQDKESLIKNEKELKEFEQENLAPLKNPLEKTSDWVRAAIKRMIKMAVDEGKDGIAWTPAHLQVERWSNATRAVVDKIEFEKTPSASGNKIAVSTVGRNRTNHIFYENTEGKYFSPDGESIESVFGGEMSKQILNGEKYGTIEGENIIVGGQGYIDIYDKTAVDVANKIAKKYGLEVGISEVKAKGEVEWIDDKDVTTEKLVKVHSLIFNEKLKEDIAKQTELEIFAKRDEPTVNHEFRNITDFIKDQNDSELLKDRVDLNVGDEREKIKLENPELYKEIEQQEKLQDEEYKRLIVPQDQINAKRDDAPEPKGRTYNIVTLLKDQAKSYFGKEDIYINDGGDLFKIHDESQFDRVSDKIKFYMYSPTEYSGVYGEERNVTDEERVGAKADEKKRIIESPVDTAWFQELFTDKDRIVNASEIEQIIKDVDDNLTNYIDGITIKNIPQARRAASLTAHSLLELWKMRMIDKALPKTSLYERKEIARLLNIPIRGKLEGYTKDIKYITDIVENANFRKLLQDVNKEKGYARNRFLRYNKDDVQFYSSVNKLTSINTRFFETQAQLAKYAEMLSAKPENVNVQDFKSDVNSLWNEYTDWKKKFNEKYESTGDVISEDDTILNEQLFYDKKQIIKEAVKTRLVNNGKTELDKRTIDSFAHIDIDQMDEREVEEYSAALKYLLLNPETANHKVVQIVNKYRANDWAERVPSEVSKKYVDIINKKSLASHSMYQELLKGTLPAVGWNYDKLGNISPYNVKSLLEIAEGMSKETFGILRDEITNTINKNYQDFLINKSDALRKIAVKNTGFSIAQMHVLGIKALLEQKPQFQVTANVLKKLSEEGIDISDIGDGEILDSNSPYADAYNYILKASNEMIKESILVSFGIKPDDTWTDDEMASILADTAIMSHRTESQIKTELAELLKHSGKTDIRELVDAIADGTHQVSAAEQAYLDKLRQTSNEVADGKYSGSMSFQSASEQLQGIQFQRIDNYAPLMRFKTYLTTEKYLGNEAESDSKLFYGIYNDFQMNTQFLEKRKPTVMSLETNAYEMFSKRLDQQIYYLNHIEHQNYLKSVFRTPVFYGKGGVFNVEATNQIVELLNGNYNRGVNEKRAELERDPQNRFWTQAMNRYKAVAVGDWLKGSSQLTTVVSNMAKMQGNLFNKTADVVQSLPLMTDSYVQGSPANLFISKYAPEVYYRGLNTYDFMGISHEDTPTETQDVTGMSKLSRMISESKRNSGKVSGVIGGLERGMYATDKSRLRNVASEIANPKSDFGTNWNLAALKFNDRLAARTSFFATYLNYCKYKGVKVDLENPNQEALNYALESVRETQHSDNPLQRSGLSYSAMAGGGKPLIGEWGMINMLAFKSYAINERQTLMKASERLRVAIGKGDMAEAADASAYFAYSFAGKVMFNYIKLYAQKYILAILAANLNSTNDKKAMIQASIGNYGNWKNVGMRSMLDYFTLASPLKWAASAALSTGEAYVKGQMTPEDKEKYSGTEGFNNFFMRGFSEDVADNLFRTGGSMVSTVKEQGASKESAEEIAKFSILLSQMGMGTPGAPIASDLLKEMSKQNDLSKRKHKKSSGTHY